MKSCSLCNKDLDQNKDHSLGCAYCKERIYCSKKCFKYDWDSRHYSECSKYLKEKINVL